MKRASRLSMYYCVLRRHPWLWACFLLLIFLVCSSPGDVVRLQYRAARGRLNVILRETNSKLTSPEATHDPRIHHQHYAEIVDIDCSALGFADKVVTAGQRYDGGKQERSGCLSRHQQHCYWSASQNMPSPAFFTALRNYEILHNECVEGHNLTALVLEEIPPIGSCKYLVWESVDGTGNQLISVVSAFVYSLLTNRVLLIATHPTAGLGHLLCQPFPRSSWIIPSDFPKETIMGSTEHHGHFYERVFNQMKSDTSSSAPEHTVSKRVKLPRRLNAYITNWSTKQDQRFFCATEQKLLAHVPWLFFQSNEYSIPGFYFIPAFREALNELFPDRAVFMHAGRYLLNPRNNIWGRIKRLYAAYLSNADRRLGIQIRAWGNEYHPIINMHLLQCATRTGLLPHLLIESAFSKPNSPAYENGELAEAFAGGEHRMAKEAEEAEGRSEEYASEKAAEEHRPEDQRRKSSAIDGQKDSGETSGEDIVVLLASLRPEYYRNLTEVYAQFENVAGKSVAVVSPSWEGKQQTGELDHEEKALSDMWLLSFTHDLIITPRSTFASVAHGLAGIAPFVLSNFGLDPSNVPDPPCGKSNVAGPCFIDHPERMVCPLDASRIDDAKNSVNEVRNCVLQWGVGVNDVQSH